MQPSHPPRSFDRSRVAFVAALLYFSNWFFIGQSTNYFAGDLQASPVLHFWSLSIEEQFYLIWPILLLGLLAVRRRLHGRTWIVTSAVAVAGVASLLWALHLAADDVNRVYYGTDTRAYQLLTGALLALSPMLFQHLRGRRWNALVSATAIVALLVIGSWYVDVDPVHRGVLATIVTAALLLSLEAGDGIAKRLLSLPSVTYLGRISYGTYLWHWPVIVIAGLTMDLSPFATVVLAFIVATGIAALSSHLLELPIRQSGELHRVPRLVIAGGLACSVLAAVIVVPELARTTTSRTADVAAAEATSASADAPAVDWVAASEDKATPTFCIDAPPEQCIVVRGGGQHVTLVGDSHAISLIPAFEVVAKKFDLTLSLALDWGCAWPYDLRYAHQEPKKHEECARRRADWFDRVIPALDPDIVVLAMAGPDDPKRKVAVFGADGEPVTSNIAAIVLPGAKRVVDQLRGDGRTVVIVQPLPPSSDAENPLDCLSEGAGISRCAYTATMNPTGFERAFHALAEADDGLFTLNLDHVVCPAFPRCDAVVHGIVTKWDPGHITATYSTAIGPQVADKLAEAGVFERR